MKLFDNLERNDPEGPRHRRHEFEFLNGSSLAIVAATRDIYENAFSSFSGNRTDVRNRFRSPLNHAHNGAAFELLIHELLRCRGLNPRPAILPNGQTPDFMIDLEDGSTALVEATMLRDGENIYTNSILDMIESMSCEGVQLDVRVRGAPNADISKKKFLGALRAHVAALDLDELSSPTFEYGRKRFTYTVPGGEVLITPRFREGRMRALGVVSVHQREMATEEDVREGLREKRSAYREPGMPYVIALSSAKRFLAERMFDGALYGLRPGASADVQGMWTKATGKHVAGVLACYSCTPSRLSGARMQLFVDSNTDHALQGNPFGCDVAWREGRELARSEGTPVHELLGYGPDWLEGE